MSCKANRRSATLGPIALLIGLIISSGCQAPGIPVDTEPATSVLAAAAAPSDPDYAVLDAHKAQALSIATADDTGADVRFTNNVAGLPSPAVAAMQALAECEQARASRAIATTACELRRRNDILIHSTAELTDDLPIDRDAFMWRLEKHGTAAQPTVLYLAGSIHVLKPTLQAPPSYYEAFANASTLVLEVDQSTMNPEQTQQLVQKHGTLPAGTSRSDLFSATELARIDSYVSGLGIPVSMVANMQPAMLLLQAGVLEYMSMGYLPQHGVDSVFEAQKGSRLVVGLETVDQQLAAATALPLPLQAELLLETLEDVDQASLEISTLVHAWLAGDANALQRAFDAETESPAAQAWLDDLLAKRNVGMAAGLTELLNTTPSGQTIFALIGAAHLVGPGSVIELLTNAGFQPRRLRHKSLQTSP